MDKFDDPTVLARIEAIAEAVAEKAVSKTLIAIGVDVSNPISVQRDFALWRELGVLASNAEFRKDMEHIRKWRLAVESMQSKGMLTIVSLLIVGTITALWIGIQDLIIFKR